MSMLAERKIKQKWSLNPRGKAWSEDSSKFGQKMLEKMGWSHGKGLGAKEDGIVEHVKLSYKNDSKGMGYKETNDQWTEHDSNFNALLQSLSGEKDSETGLKISSLEKKSQNSKVRVHYKKFTRGKDLSRCSEKDLANIFGKKSLKQAPPPHQSEAIEEETKEGVKDSFTHNGGSMVDYFKKKLPNFGKINGYVVGSNGVLKNESESEDEAYCGFGFKSPGSNKRRSDEETAHGTPKKIKSEEGLSNPAFDPLFGKVDVQKHVLNTITEESEEIEEREVKKKKKRETLSVLDAREEMKIDETVEDQKKKKKKRKLGNGEESQNRTINEEEKKKKRNGGNDSFALDNPNFDEEGCHNGFANGNFEIKRKSKKNEDESLGGKKKKDKKNESFAVDNPNFDDKDDSQISCVSKDFEVKRKKKKDKKIGSLAIDNPIFDNREDCQSSCVNEDFEVRRKKKKEKKNEFLAVDNPNFDDKEDSQVSYVNEDFEVRRKKKKEKKLVMDNPNFVDREEESFEAKRKKKKSEEDSIAIDNPNFDEGDSKRSYVDENYEVKRKKKKKKSEDSSRDNPNFNDSEETSPCVIDSSSTEDKQQTKKEETEEPTFDLMLNVTSTPSLPKTTHKSTPQSSAKRRKSVRFNNKIEERIIPNNEDIENRNELFDINSKVIANGLRGANIEEFSKKIEGFQAEIENDINEAKCKYIGHVGNPDGENEKLPDGTKLKFKYAKFGKTPVWANKRTSSSSRSSYKHLIKGDIVVGFKNTNLHEIKGYGVEGKN